VGPGQGRHVRAARLRAACRPVRAALLVGHARRGPVALPVPGVVGPVVPVAVAPMRVAAAVTTAAAVAA